MRVDIMVGAVDDQRHQHPDNHCTLFPTFLRFIDCNNFVGDHINRIPDKVSPQAMQCFIFERVTHYWTHHFIIFTTESPDTLPTPNPGPLNFCPLQ